MSTGLVAISAEAKSFVLAVCQTIWAEAKI